MRVLISHMVANRVNLMQNDYCAGIPSPTAFLGLAATISHRLGMGRWSVGVLPILHDVTPSIGRLRPAMEPKSGVYKTVEIQEDMTGQVRFSLLVDFEGLRTPEAVRDAVTGLRLAGGVIFDDGGPVRATLVPEDAGALRTSRRGYALVPRICEHKNASAFGDAGSLAEVASELWPENRAENRGWRVPVAIGYRLLGRPGPAPRGSRDPGIPHVFAEPGVGVGELISVRSRRLGELGPGTFRDLFWSWSVTETHILAHRAYAA
ncbi:type I-F CRISPR-associated protein Csy2 [Defluviimonas salinarum]|uniref:Uncharacterized protein n=1 Tax=Defluviimonas salinarum TaxID=2992147 RepID=A0ABT3J9M8_9RHOB|nr:type I-F CRISPR-associated protein Csy2 [Defluviimonas salinarum]MCW3784385.1 hypothetical protein [Defluviimonas salinarum]